MSHHPVDRSARGRVVLLVLFVVLVAAAVAAVPAAATPTLTSFELREQSATVNWGATAILNGVLQTDENPRRPVDQQQILVQYSATSVLPDWTERPDSPITNSSAPYSSGEYTYSWTATRNYYWRMVFEGTAEWGPRTSNVVYVKVVPVIGKPACPSSAKAGKKLTVSGTIKPHYRSGSKNVKVKAQRYASGKWKAYKTYTATTTDSGSYSKYSLKFSISKTGKYRFYATTASATTLAAGRSAYSRSMQVK
jgi:hypothetical protein